MTTVTIADKATGADFTGCEDAEATESTPTTNNGTAISLNASTFATGDRRFGFIKFSGLSNIAGPVTVSSAKVRLYQLQGSAGPRNLQLKRCLRDWAESQATWNIYSTGNSWTSGGGLSDGNDRSSTVSASVALSSGAAGYLELTGAQLATDVQNIINGSVSNFGWHIGLDNETANDGKFWQFATSENIDGSPNTYDNRPELVIVYTAGGGGVKKGSHFYRHIAGFGG